jgi:hypothetical protein
MKLKKTLLSGQGFFVGSATGQPLLGPCSVPAFPTSPVELPNTGGCAFFTQSDQLERPETLQNL